MDNEDRDDILLDKLIQSQKENNEEIDYYWNIALNEVTTENLNKFINRYNEDFSLSYFDLTPNEEYLSMISKNKFKLSFHNRYHIPNKNTINYVCNHFTKLGYISGFDGLAFWFEI